MRNVQQVEALLSKLESIVSDSTKIPLTNKVMVDSDEISDLVELIRRALPEEMQEAAEMVSEREEILSRARIDGEFIMARAEEAVARMVDETAIAAEAQQRAEAMIEKTKSIAHEIHERSIEYADGVLERLEGQVRETLEQIHRHRAELRG